ncbi:HAD-IC family P-type ATPase [Persicobacter sp. CCB-QB2]|uniref:HAD-IC family P-type ATPase n=1 Tax=Persicobacter sp. CCB-QB2 TaxID=1561025 RepID=UPI000AE453A9|nr:HAD-IC family P-type ATPase [Persicobacter sp. CCB-QB2]
MTITLAIGVSRMARRKAIIRKLPAVETLGSTTVICSDKTGTLTQNQMTVQALYCEGKVYSVSGVGYAPVGEIFYKGQKINALQERSLTTLLHCGYLCNDAQLVQEKEWEINGDPTEGALIVVAQKAGLDAAKLMVDFPRLDAIPFESEHQYSATLHKGFTNNILYVKGSVERIMTFCDTLLESEKALILQQAEAFGEKGMRVLAFAGKAIKAQQSEVEESDVRSGLEFFGLHAMIDPPRPEAIEAVDAVQKAGMKVKMITGDHKSTAQAIARQLGMNNAEKGMSGLELNDLEEKEIPPLAEEYAVFARVSPEQKLLLVKALQQKGHIAAMTGDGVNDAPALQQANIGVAMGKGGTEVARETSDMILTDDNFATIRAAVEEGRAVLDNLIKFIGWTLPTNISEGMVILMAALMGVALPILPLQILWINMSTAIFLGSTLAVERKEWNLMNRLPRAADAPILDREMVFRLLWVSAYIVIAVFAIYRFALEQGHSIAYGRTMAVNMIVFAELVYLLNCRSLHHSPIKIGFFSNHWLILGILVMIFLQMLFTYWPVMNQLFGSVSISGADWMRILAASGLLFGLVEVEKLVKRRLG